MASDGARNQSNFQPPQQQVHAELQRASRPGRAMKGHTPGPEQPEGCKLSKATVASEVDLPQDLPITVTMAFKDWGIRTVGACGLWSGSASSLYLLWLSQNLRPWNKLLWPSGDGESGHEATSSCHFRGSTLIFMMAKMVTRPKMMPMVVITMTTLMKKLRTM